MKRQHSPSSVTGKTIVIDGIEYRRLERTFDPEALFVFNKTHGSSPHNFMPEDEPIRAHFAGLSTGETFVWAAFSEGNLVGLISGTTGGEYWSQTGTGPGATSFIDEFVVHPGYRGKGIGRQ
jgi:GNAT superfamily N-acetyltransferase